MSYRSIRGLTLGLVLLTGCSTITPSPPISSATAAIRTSSPVASAELTPSPPSGPPANGSIAFVRYQAGKPSVWLIEPDGSNERIQVEDPLSGTRPAWTCLAADRAITSWSPNGEWLAFGVGQGMACDALFGVVRRDGSGLRMLGGGTWLAWSPNGQGYALARNIDASFSIRQEVHIFDIRGRDTRDPLGGSRPIMDPPHSRPGDLPRFEVLDVADPRYSPDGARLALSVQAFPPGDGSRTQILDLVSNQAIEVGRGSPRAWSPDGTRVLVVRSEGNARVGFSMSIYDVAADGSGERRVDQAAALAHPTWSPDGHLIAYFAGATVVIVAADGSDRIEVPAVAAPQFGTSLQWSPDGRWLVFSLERGLITTIYICGRDGTGLRALTKGRSPAWQPVFE